MRINHNQRSSTEIGSAAEFGFKNITPAKSMAKQRVFVFEAEDETFAIPRTWFTSKGQRGLEELARRGQLPLGVDMPARLIGYLAGFKAFPDKPLLDHPGFNGTYFQTFDGFAVSPAGRPAGLSVNAEARTSAPDEDRIDATRKLFAAVYGHWSCEFALVLGFAALVKAFTGMPRQPVILLCGGPEADTSLLLDLTAWAAGAPLGHPDGQYALALDQSATGLSEALNGYRDHAIVIDPSGYFSKVESKKTLLAKWTILAHVLSSGHVRARGGPAPVSRSFVAALSADSSGQDLISSKFGDGGEFDGMYRTRVDEPFGLFGKRAEEQGGAANLQAEIAELIRASYGTLLARFAQWLVDSAARDRARLETRIERLRNVFRGQVGARAIFDQSAS